MKTFLVLFLAAVVFAGCSPTKMALSSDFLEKDEYVVKGRQGLMINQKLSFGNFSTSRIKRSWTKGSSSVSGAGYHNEKSEWTNLISTEYIDKKQSLHFSLSDGRFTADVFGVSRFNAKDLKIGASENSILNIAMDIAGIGDASANVYYVQVFFNGAQPWQLLLDNQAAQGKAGSYSGIFARSTKEYYTIVPVNKLDQNGKIRTMPFGSVGFEVQNPSGVAVAAVSTMDKGMVFLGKTTDEERFLLASLCSAILLQENIGD